MFVVVKEFSRDIFSYSGACKYIFRQSRVTNFAVFPLGAHHRAALHKY